MHSAFPAGPVPCTVPAVQDPVAALAGTSSGATISSSAGTSSRSLDCQSSPSWVSMMDVVAQRSLSSPITNFSSLSLPSQPGSLNWPFDAQSCSALVWAPDPRIFDFNPSAFAVKAPATRPKPTGRRPRQPAAIYTSKAKAKATAASASAKSASSSAVSSATTSPSSSRGISPRSKPKMPGRPPKRPASNGEDDGPVQAPGKVKLPRLERGPDDFSSVVKNRLQSYTRTGQACDRCKVRHGQGGFLRRDTNRALYRFARSDAMLSQRDVPIAPTRTSSVMSQTASQGAPSAEDICKSWRGKRATCWHISATSRSC